jgi:hypothetical protein
MNITDVVRGTEAYRAARALALDEANIAVAQCMFLDTPADATIALRYEGGFTGIAKRAIEYALAKVPGCFKPIGNPPVTANVARVLRAEAYEISQITRDKWVSK